MKKLTLILLLFIPILSYGQIIVDKKLGEIDIRTLSDKYISVGLNYYFPSSHMLSTSEYKKVLLMTAKRKKKWNVYDNGNLIRLTDKVDILNFFSKYGWKLASTDVANGGGITNLYEGSNMAYTIPITSTTLIFTKE
tara:strand:+ start:78 stop:488 length:411 start_codon:yes stop_codon:yes gene_type:complete